MNKGINMATQEQIKQLEEELRIAQDEEAKLNKQSNGQEGTWAVEEARARLNMQMAAQKNEAKVVKVIKRSELVRVGISVMQGLTDDPEFIIRRLIEMNTPTEFVEPIRYYIKHYGITNFFKLFNNTTAQMKKAHKRR